MLKIGVIGVGVMGRHHARVYSEMLDVELIGISDINEEQSKEIASKYNTKSFLDYVELLEKVDAVSIAVPTRLHEKVALDAIKKNCHILIEKPISNTIVTAKNIIECANRQNLKLMVGHIERFNPLISVLKKALRNQDILLIEITRMGPLPPRVKDIGVVVDIGIHDIDLLKYITESKFEKILSISSSNGKEHEDTALLSFKMKNGVLAHITTNWLTPYKVREIMVATKTMVLKGDLITQKLTEYKKTDEIGAYSVKELQVNYKEPLKSELEEFVGAIKEDRTPLVSGNDGLYALKIALKAIQQ